MDASINATVGMATALQQFNSSQQAQAELFKENLDTQASQVNQLMESVNPPGQAVAPEGQLATSGTTGTQINTYA
ncbi:putative motility protein [Halomonas sp. I5-271120]|uniref:putative motility protein n=1 Tax=Halomonas sp. I5-271120 TaxID=3061632 RepID=UPI0027151143|nr:putative motility protein [Halomonas sp. I5-271120]